MLQAPLSQRSSTYCSIPWVVFLNRTSITTEDLWPTHMVRIIIFIHFFLMTLNCSLDLHCTSQDPIWPMSEKKPVKPLRLHKNKIPSE